MDANDALSSYDPYGTGVYKGVKVEATVVDESVRLLSLLVQRLLLCSTSNFALRF